MEEEQQILKYGDNIILRCMVDNKIYYLLARNEQYLMETRLQLGNSCTFNMYNFPQHMVFTVFPKLLYEAQKKYNSDQQFGASLDFQKQLLYTRMETEKKYNQNLLKQTKGQKIMYGDTIMLYQPLSQVFLLRAENNNSNSNIGTILSSSMYFTVQPDPLALDIKQGCPVHSFDQFLLVQSDTILKFDTLQEIYRLPEVVKSHNLDHNNQFLTIPAMIENQYQFKFYKAQYRQFATDSKESISHNTLQAIVLKQDKDKLHLFYGQYVRIVHMQQKIKKERQESRVRSIKIEDAQENQINKGYLTSSINAVGCYPQVYLQINDVQNADLIEKAASIFQILPENDQKYSDEIQFNVGNKPNLVGYTTFLLRHMLTGEFLRVNPFDNKLQLSKEIINKYRQINSMSSKKLDAVKQTEPKSTTQKNLPGIKLYRNLMNQQNNNVQNNIPNQQDDRFATQYQQTQSNQEEVDQDSCLADHQLLFVTKLGNNPIFYKDQLPFTNDTTFNIATKDGKSPIEVDNQEEGGYQVKLITKLGMFNQYGEENVEQALYRQLHEEWTTLIPDLDSFMKKNKYQLSAQEKQVLEFIEYEKKRQAKNKVDMRHYKSDDETFKPTFINLNPLNTKYMDVLASEEFSGSNFKFEVVVQSEIEELSEVLDLMFPIIALAKNSIQLSTLKFKFKDLKFKDSKEQKDLASQFLRCQAQTVQNVNQAVKSLIKIMLWLTASQETLAQENLISEPLVRRQCIAREIGCIDYVNKIIYELNINGLLYEDKDQIRQDEIQEEVQDEELFQQDINQLIDALSSFLQLVCKNSSDNSLYVVQWYCLYKHILLRGQVNDLMRLDILITQLFQQSDVMVSFEFEVTQLSKETKFTNYNKHAFNLLIAFCLFTEFRKKEGIEGIIDHIFKQNKNSIFSQYIFDGNFQSVLREKLQDFSKTIRKSIESNNSSPNPIMIDGVNLQNKQQQHDYIISCVRLASEISKSSPALTLKEIKTLFPFYTVAQIIQDNSISSLTKSYFLELFQNSYMAKHLKPLPMAQFPQYLKMVVKQNKGKGFLSLFRKEEYEIILYAFAQKKISDVYQKVAKKYLVESDKTVDFWLYLSDFISNFWKTKSIYEIKGNDHVYIKQLILTFTEFLKKGLFIEYLSNAHNFYNMYHKFIEFLKNSVVSATLEEKYIKHQLQGNKKSKEQKPLEVKDYLFESTVTQRKVSRTTTYAKSMIWLDELIEILILLEQFQQSRMADQFIITEDNQTIFDDLQYLQKFAKDKKYADVVQRLRQAKRASYHTRGQPSQSQLGQKDIFTTQELATMLRECSYARKTVILEYMGGIKQTDISLVYFLIELLTLNQIRLSAKVTELLWLIYSSRSNFLQTLNQTILIEAFDQGELQLLVNQNIFTDFSNIYWKLHFAIIDLKSSLEKDSSKHYETINDALSDMLVIFFPDYAAKSDMQMFMEINQLENEEKHYQAQEEKMVKSKVKQEVAIIEQFVSKAELDLIDVSAQSPMRDKQEEQLQSLKSATMDQQQKYVWKINNSLSIDVLTIFYRQKLLRYLGFHDLMQKLVENLIQETSTLFREKDVLVSNANKKGWEIKSDILEKSILFLIYFVIRNEENQEMILNLSKRKDSFLHEMSNVKRKQMQTLIYILFAELFRDNYNILFSLDKYNDENSILAKLFSIFGNNFANKNYEAAIYFLQFLQILLKVKESDVVQNNYVIVHLFQSTKQLTTFPKDIGSLIQTIYLFRLEQFFTGNHAPAPQAQHNQQKHPQFNGFIEMPIEILFMTELLRLMRFICSKRSVLINEFVKKLFPVNRVAEMLKQLDEWYPLKSELILYFQSVFLENLQFITFEEKQEVVKTITEVIFKQMTVSFVENQNLKKMANAKLVNSVVFNIFGIRNQYTNQEFIMSILHEKASFIYVIYGVLEVTKNFVKKVCPKYFFKDEQEYFEEFVQNELLFMAQTISETIQRVYEFASDMHNGGSGGRMKNSNIKRKSGQKTTKLYNLTHKLLSCNQEEQNQELSILAKEDNEVDKDNIIRIIDTIQSVQTLDIAFQLQRNDLQQGEQGILDKWTNSIKSQRTKLIDEHLVASERENEIQQLVNLIVTLKRDDTTKFKRMVTALIQMLSETSVSPSIKLKSINIVRKLSNYKEDLHITKSILKDLGELGFTDFLCDLIKLEGDSEQKLEYIKAFVDYIDDSSREIQNSFLLYLQRDPQNMFINNMQNFITDMFQDVRMAEISKIERKNRNINRILNNKINGCILIFEMFRLGCEDHFSDMQNFLRIQPNSKQPINFIMFTADLFEKYVEIMNEHNAALGQKILDFLIECVQGPCLENQTELCQSTKILEALEQIIVQQRVEKEMFQRRDIVFSSLRSKVFLLQLSLMEGNSDQEIARKISHYFNPEIFFERVYLVYWKIIKKIRNTQMQINLEVKVLDRVKSEAEEAINHHGVIQTKDTKETLPNQNLFMEFFSENFHSARSHQHLKVSSQTFVNAIQEEDMEEMVGETFMMYLLLKKLTRYIPRIKDIESNPKLRRALNYYKNETASIEIVNMNGKLEKIYFQVPTLMKYLTEETKLQFMEEVERDSINDKINGLLDNMDYFYMEMVHFMKLRKIGIRFNNNFIVYLRNVCIILALLLNILITINDTEEKLANLAKAIAILDCILYGLIMLIWIFIRMQLEYDRIYKQVSDLIQLNYNKKSNQGQSQQVNPKTVIYPFQITLLQTFHIIKRMLFSSYTFYWFLLLVVNLLGLLYNKLFYGFLLLDIIDHSQVLRNVIKSISLNYKQLLMTALLGVLIMYLYSLVAYQSDDFKQQLKENNNNGGDEASDHFDSTVCYSAFQCLVFVIHQGLRAGGGIGDVLEAPPTHSNQDYYSQRVLYDVSFFILINIIWLNIIFGIIIDTFAELRDQKNQKDFDSQNRCYICDLTRTVFEKEGISFDNHVNKYHNPWNYLAYLIYLKVKQKTEHTGTESYVYSKFLQNDISWLPIQKAIDLELIVEQQPKQTVDFNVEEHNQKSLH
uniref:Calcium release channel IV1b n=1 Tax=Paramecium tetraurelia TaxID=5888 RepID=C3KGH9_PARTE|nr:TPA: calcium release channel IV1b [Paramecium tetraurelia]